MIDRCRSGEWKLHFLKTIMLWEDKMEKQEWLFKQLQEIYNQSKDFNEVVLIKAIQNIINEQTKRIEQMEGELEGTLWSPRKWGE